MEKAENADHKQLFTMSYSKNESKSVCASINKDLNTISDYLQFHCESKPDCEAVIFAHSDGSRQAVTFKDVYENARQIAKNLISLGVRKSEVVAVSLRDCPEWLYVVYGTMMAGARPISLSFTYTDGSDVIAMMKKLQTCSVIVLDPGAKRENWNIFRKLVSNYNEKGDVKSDKMPYLRHLICHEKPEGIENVLTLSEMLAWTYSDISLPALDPTDIAVLLQTSGSTGVPKAIAHTHISILSATACMSDNAAMAFEPTEKLFNDRPFAWLGGFPTSVITGQCRVTRSKYCGPAEDDVSELIDVIQREKCTVAGFLPMMLSNLMEKQDTIGDNWPLHTIFVGGQPMAKRFANCVGKLCDRVVFAYGSTEFLLSSSISIENPDDFKQHLVGPPSPGIEMKIVNEEEEIVPVNNSGEIYIKTKFLFKEYYNDPAATKACLTEDGWFRSDDVGFMDETGKFYCEGRKSEMIICGGMNVAPSILEATIEKCPGVARAICVPVPHDVLYQVICACVILEGGSNVTEEQLRMFCDEVHNDQPRLFTVVPSYYIFMDKFPETYTGKIARKELTKYVTERLSKQL